MTLIWLAAIAFCLGWHSTNGLLALIAVSLLDVGLTVDRIRQGVTDLCQMLKDDEALTDAERAVMADAGIQTPPTIAKAPTSPSWVHPPARDWLTHGTKES